VKVLTISEIKERFRDEWVLILNPDKNEIGEIIKGEILFHNPDKQKVYDELLKHRMKHIGLIFTGNLAIDIPTLFGGEIM
jgi:hypothetical protein